ncbi:MAG: 3'(2'),5'-bisphosphate nucleotidase CysQ [Rhodomicrobium sp.]
MSLGAAEYKDFAHALLLEAQRAGAAIMDIYRSGADVRYKADRSPVTGADNASERILLAALSELAPGVPVIAEEQAAAGMNPPIGSEYFLVDPLDGTKEFLKVNGEFTVNVALVVDKKPVFGLVYAPAKSDCYVTLTQKTAFRCFLPPAHNPAPEQELEFLPLTGEPAVPRSVTAIISRSHPRPEVIEFLDKLGIVERITLGSSLKFGVLARGEADVYPRFGPTSEWDIAAGQVILEAAGGCVVTAGGEPFIYGKQAEGFTNLPFIAWRRRPD